MREDGEPGTRSPAIARGRETYPCGICIYADEVRTITYSDGRPARKGSPCELDQMRWLVASAREETDGTEG